MVKDEVLTVKDAVHKLQLCLLEGVKDDNLLSAAGSLISRSDYCDVVTERTIAKICGYPLCSVSMPSERPWKGRYRISLKEHRVYDLEETYMYCSSDCLINSRAFTGSLQEERSSSLNPGKLDELLKLFDGSSSDSVHDMGKNGDLGMSELKIQEKMDTKMGEVSLEDWIGPSNAIDGYVPRKDRNTEPKRANNLKKGGRHKQVEPKPKPAQPDLSDILRDDMNFTSTIIMGDEYSISKRQVEPKPGRAQPDLSDILCDEMNFTSTITMEDKYSISKKQVEPKHRHAQLDMSDILRNDMNFTSTIIMGDEYIISNNAPDLKANESERKTNVKCAKDGGKAKQVHDIPLSKSQVTRSQKSDKIKIIEKNKLCISEDVSGATDQNRNAVATGSISLKSSLKNSVSDRASHSVTWADEKMDAVQNLCEYSELQDKKVAALPSSTYKEIGEESNRFLSVEACAMGLSQAAEAVASGKSDVPDALSEAGITILPPTNSVDKAKILENADDLEIDPMIMKWPIKPGFSNDDLFDSEDSWYESPPEGFSLALSPFSTMFMALFSWLSSSSLAYIYGRDEISHTDFLSVNGREYPRKIVLSDGRSSEIKQTLSGCLSRALPEFVAELKLPIPISTLEQGMGRLVETMSFVDPLPAFRMKQWQVIILLFLDALSVSRITSLTQHIMGRRILLPKVLECAQISAEEYEIMKDLIIPLGRVPAFSTQSGG